MRLSDCSDLSSTFHFAFFICLSHLPLHPLELWLPPFHLPCGCPRSKIPCAVRPMRSLALWPTTLLSHDVLIASVQLHQPSRSAPAIVEFREVSGLGHIVPIRLSEYRYARCVFTPFESLSRRNGSRSTHSVRATTATVETQSWSPASLSLSSRCENISPVHWVPCSCSQSDPLMARNTLVDTNFFWRLQDKEHKDPDTIDLGAPRRAQYMHKHGRNIKTQCIVMTSNLRKRKDLSSIKHDLTQSSFTKRFQFLVFWRLSWWNLEKSFYEKVYASSRPPPKISFRDDWMKELGSEVAGGGC